MQRQHFFVFWIGLALSVALAYSIVKPVHELMLPANLQNLLGAAELDPLTTPAKAALARAEAVGNILVWEMSIIVLIITLCIAGGAALLSLSELRPADDPWRYAIPLAVLLLAVIVFAWHFTGVGDDRGVTAIEPATRSAADGASASAGQAGFQYVYRALGRGVPKIEVIASAATRAAAVGTAASILVLAAMLGLTFRSAHLVAAQGSDVELAAVRERLLRLQALLYLAGLGLASGVLATAMRLSLQVEPSLSDDAIEAAASIVRSVTLAYGGMYSLILLLGYIPAAVILGRWSRQLAHRALPRADAAAQQAWRVEQRLEPPRISQFWQLFAALAPFVTSVLGEPTANLLTGLLP